MSELSQRASDRRDAEHIRDDGYRTDEERRLAGRYIALDDVLIAAEAKIERRNATYTKPGEGFVCFHCGERFLTYESAKEHFGEKPDAQPTCFATPSPTIAADERCESCRKVLGRRWKYDASGDVKLCPHCYAELRREGRMTQAQGLAAALATPSPTIAAPSPLNEPAVEWVMCAVRDAMREHNFVVERGSDLWNRLRRHIEAALTKENTLDG